MSVGSGERTRHGGRPRALRWILLAALVLTAATASIAADLRGTLVLLNKSGSRASRSGDPSHGIVYFEPASRVGVEPAAEAAILTTRDKEFVPRILVVTRGSKVRFPNEDPILHNVFSVSGDNRFDLGLYGRGAGEQWTFSERGIVRVYCNVHRQMVAYIAVLETPFFATPDAMGHFVLRDLPRGKGRLTVWHPRAEPLSDAVEIGVSGTERELSLRLTRPRVSKHTNKLGKPYSRSRSAY